jgi:hypothetical protein
MRRRERQIESAAEITKSERERAKKEKLAFFLNHNLRKFKKFKFF